MSALNQPIIATSPIAREVLDGLSRYPKSLPPKLFYDARGSELFEAITELPEYYPTRTERQILAENARAIARQVGGEVCLIELGAGTASKTRLLITALLRLQRKLRFYPVDVSAAALEEAARHLNGDFPGLELHPVVADYRDAMGRIRGTRGRKLVLWLGSSIGNYEPMQAGALLRSVRNSLRSGDALLLGFDRVKSESILVPAYDDAQGVTAEFNKNVLARINRELGGHFDLDAFLHVAVWNPQFSRMEMHLESRSRQQVAIDELGILVPFQKGERIHTENSYKFTDHMIQSILDMGGFVPECRWSDPQDWFSVTLARVQ